MNVEFFFFFFGEILACGYCVICVLIACEIDLVCECDFFFFSKYRFMGFNHCLLVKILNMSFNGGSQAILL